MSKYPYLQLFTGDWLKDPKLSLCAPATRGVWMDLICAMHELDRSGELRGTMEQLSRLARCSTVELAQALTDLQTTGAAGVTDRNGVVTVVNFRMQREHRDRLNATARVSKHRRGKGKGGGDSGSETPLKRPRNGDISDSESTSTLSGDPDVAAETRAREAPGDSAGQQQQQQIHLPVDEAFLDKLDAMARYRRRGVRVREVLDTMMLKTGLTRGQVGRNQLIDWCNREWPEPQEVATHGRNGGAGAQGARPSDKQARDIANAEGADELRRRLIESAGEAVRGGGDGDRLALTGTG
jgi:hypothetical protein